MYNQPLQVIQITASYLNQYALVKLNAQVGYRLMFGHETLSAPNYDLKKFAHKVSAADAIKIKHNAIGSLEVLILMGKKRLVLLRILILYGALYSS